MNYQNLISEFELNLENVQSLNDDILCKAEAGMTHAKRYLKRLRMQVIQKGFPSPKEEIHFFKHIKPRIFSKLIYNAKLFNIESKRPRGTVKCKVKYLNNQIKRLQSYFNDNLEFYHYFRRDASALDKLYFLRGESDLRSSITSFPFFIDEQFSTCQDNTVATILAYDMLIDYLHAEIEQLELDSRIINPKENPINEPTKLSWTGGKTELTELIYALQSSGVLSSGTADIKEIAALFECMFNVNLGNYYHTFIEIRARKSSKTKFLDRLVEVLNKRIEQSDK